MKSPLQGRSILDVPETDSTQTLAVGCVVRGDDVGVVIAQNQTQGKGRFDRTWHSAPGESLTMSLICWDYAEHPAPQFIGMAVACACAASLNCELQWPNDLVFGGRKVGGILTELILDGKGRRIPVVGVGVNLNQTGFPDEIASRAISLTIYRGGKYDAHEVAQAILDRLTLQPEPDSWEALGPTWMLFDHTPGKSYRLPDGTEAIAMGIAQDGSLVCANDGQVRHVLAAEAIFGAHSAS